MGGSESGRRAKVLLFAALLLAAGSALFLAVTAIETEPAVDLAIPWVVLVAAFTVAELCAVHLEFRGDAQTFSLSELPLVVGLLCVPPDELVAARLVGGVIAIALARQSALKVAFNASLMVFWAALAAFVYHAVVSWSPAPEPRHWVAAFVAVLTVSSTDAAIIGVVVHLSGGRIDLATSRTILIVGAIAAAATTSLSILAVGAMADSVGAGVLVAVVATVLYAAYRAYTGSQQRYKKLQQLYEFTRALNRSPEFDNAARAILAEAAELLRSERAELYLLERDGPAVTRIVLGDGGDVCSHTVASVAHAPLLDAVLTGDTVRVARGPRGGAERALLVAADAADLMVQPLGQAGAIIGALAVLDRLGEVSTFEDDDVKVLATFASHASMSLQNATLIEELRHEAAAKEHQSLHDSLTGLANRANLYRASKDALERAEATSERVALLLMDLDRFKEINDTLGHRHGDLLLQQLAQRLVRVAAPGTTVARLGGDEFAILLPAAGSIERAVEAAHAIQAVFAQPFVIDELELDISGSIGVAVSPEHGTLTDVLMQRADVAMYTAKDSDHAVEVYRLEQDEHSARRLALAAALRHAIELKGLSVAYQPKACLATGSIIGVEALARWHHPEFGTVPPDDFIALAEHVGLIRPLTMFMLDEALGQLQRWRAAGIDVGVAVNLSVRNLVDSSLPRDVRCLLEQYRIEPAMLTLEITESEIMRDPERTMTVLGRLQSLGVQLSIDDFGTGHSSLAYLRRLPVHEVKIDKSFVFGLASNDVDRAIVRSIVDLARSRGLRVVAEGVEDSVAWDRLRELGCDVAQGYYLSRPQPADDLTAWLASHRADGPLSAAAAS